MIKIFEDVGGRLYFGERVIQLLHGFLCKRVYMCVYFIFLWKKVSVCMCACAR